MNRRQALQLLDKMPTAQSVAANMGDFNEYLAGMDPEILAERVAEAIALAGPDSWKALRNWLSHRNARGVGLEVLIICGPLFDSIETEFGELTGWIHQERDDRQTRRLA